MRGPEGAIELRFQFEDYVLDTDRRELRRGGDLVPLAPRDFDLLDHLIRNRQRVVSKDDLIAAVWDGRIVSESALTTRINAVRRAIGDSGEKQRLIKTLPQKGIRFVGAVREDQVLAGGRPADSVPAEPSRPVLTLPDKPSVAVLPFTNVGGDPEQDYFADGMADEIINALSRCSWLFVIARNSSFTYKGRAVDIRQVGRELGVRYVLEGSVRRGGDRLRLTGQLIEAATGAHIWADRFDGEMSDIFDLQDRITANIVGAIEPKLQLAEFERLKQKSAADLNAYDLLLRAQQLHYEFTEEAFSAAIQCLHQALAIDPSYAPAMALAAYCYVERRLQGWPQNPEAEAVVGHRLATRAVDLARDDANALWMAAWAIRVLGKDPSRAGELLRLSLQLNPNSVMALTAAAWSESLLGNPTEALQLLDRAERISPRDPRAWLMASARANAHFMGDQYSEAASWARKALARNPRSTRALRILGMSLAILGEMDKAAEVIREVLTIEPGLTISKMRARLDFWTEAAWKKPAEALRLAGLPE
jgi:TolB-like protein